MPSTLNIPVPSDYNLARDYCSYGYFLLSPSHWDPATRAVTRVLDLEGGAVSVRVSQPSAPAQSFASPGSPLRVVADRQLARAEIAEVKRQLTRLLRLDEDDATILAFHKLDPRWKARTRSGVHAAPEMKKSSSHGRGRLMRSPTFFEDVIKTITSCNVTWPSTISMNRRLCEALGSRSPSGGAAFPSARLIARTRPATLRARCGVGYRDARIVEIARLFTKPAAKGGIDAEWYEDSSTPDDAVYEALLELPGIGPYAAANIMQLLGRYSRLPLDTESLRHAKTILGMTGADRAIMKRLHDHYAPFGAHAFRSYWFELWEFYELKRGPAWTWERETTGKSFTAALLKEKPASDAE